AVFVISSGPVNFHTFARLFRDGLGLPDALYFDGNISRLNAPALGRDEFGFPMGPIVALAAPADSRAGAYSLAGVLHFRRGNTWHARRAATYPDGWSSTNPPASPRPPS